MVDMGPLNKEIIEFCESNLGKKVGEGRYVPTWLEKAFKIVNAKPIQFSGKTYIWGREVTAGQKVLPGDIVQLEDCKFKNSSAPHHTQVIRRILGPNRYEVLEQNSNGRRTVRARPSRPQPSARRYRKNLSPLCQMILHE